MLLRLFLCICHWYCFFVFVCSTETLVLNRCLEILLHVFLFSSCFKMHVHCIHIELSHSLMLVNYSVVSKIHFEALIYYCAFISYVSNEFYLSFKWFTGKVCYLRTSWTVLGEHSKGWQRGRGTQILWACVDSALHHTSSTPQYWFALWSGPGTLWEPQSSGARHSHTSPRQELLVSSFNRTS